VIDTVLIPMASRGVKKLVEMATAKAPEAASRLIKRQVVERTIRSDYVPTMMRRAANGASAQTAILHGSIAMAEKAAAHSVLAEKAVGLAAGIAADAAQNATKTACKKFFEGRKEDSESASAAPSLDES
jgi:hypothetical protein